MLPVLRGGHVRIGGPAVREYSYFCIFFKKPAACCNHSGYQPVFPVIYNAPKMISLFPFAIRQIAVIIDSNRHRARGG